MLKIDKILTIIKYLAYYGSGILCIGFLLVRLGLWLVNSKKRSEKLKICTVFSICILLLLYTYRQKSIILSAINSYLSDSLSIVGFILCSLFIISVIILLIILFNAIWKAVKLLFSSDSTLQIDDEQQSISGEDIPKPVNSNFNQAIKKPEVILLIAWGIVALYTILPFFVVQPADTPLDTWFNGVAKIATYFETDVEQNTKDEDQDNSFNNFIKENSIEDLENLNNLDNLFSIYDKYVENNNSSINNDNTDSERNSGTFDINKFVIYTIAYIIIIGVGYAAVTLLASVIRKTLNKQDDSDLFAQYAMPIAFLVVCISSLWLISNHKISIENKVEFIAEITKLFITVIIIFTLVLLALEIVRLLMDMSDKLIRTEGKYIFILVIGQCSIFLTDFFNMIFEALENFVSAEPDSNVTEIMQKTRQIVVNIINKKINDEYRMDSKQNIKTNTFNRFRENKTKK